MKKLLTTTLSAALLSAGGFSAVNVLHTDNVDAAAVSYEAAPSHSHYQLQVAGESLTQLPEYATVESHVDVAGLQAKITEDSAFKRVILFKEMNGQAKYKSIFSKKSNVLEVVDLRGGQIFRGTIGTETAAPAPEAKPDVKPVQPGSDVSALPEYAMITSKADVAGLNAFVAEDNVSKRVVVFKDQNGREQYKTYFMKRDNTLKIISTTGGGQVYYGPAAQPAAVPAATVTAPAKQVAPVQQAAPVQTQAKAPAASAVSALPEYATLASVVDVTGYTAQVANDNRNSRTILLKNANGSVAYKSIYVKRTNMLKVINTRGGQIFYGAAK